MGWHNNYRNLGDVLMVGVLYHYTSRFHLPLILKDGFLKLTESNLRAPGRKELEESNEKINLIYQGKAAPAYYSEDALYKPVVWLTNTSVPVQLGMEQSGGLKHEIKISIRIQPHYEQWHIWSKKHHIEPSWAARLEEGNTAESWFISTQPIFLTANELLRIENTVTGEVLLDLDAGIRKYDCTVEPARGIMTIQQYNDWVGEHGLKKGEVISFSF